MMTPNGTHDDAGAAVPQRSVHVDGDRAARGQSRGARRQVRRASARCSSIDRYHPESMYVVPTMMARISKLPDDVRDRYDVSSLKVVWHLARAVPAVVEGGVDRLARRGDDLGALRRAPRRRPRRSSPASSGSRTAARSARRTSGEMKVVRADGTDADPGEVGEVFMRPSDDENVRTYRYVGAEARRIDGGWESLGDMGSIDADGYLYLSRPPDRHDPRRRRQHLSRPRSRPRSTSTRACGRRAVIGLPDDDLGNAVHAIVQTDDGTPIDVDELRAHLGRAARALQDPPRRSSSRPSRCATTRARSAAPRCGPSGS